MREGISHEERDRFGNKQKEQTWRTKDQIYWSQGFLPTLLKLAVFVVRFIIKCVINRLLRSYVINNYDAHFREIFLAILNEYSNWDQVNSVNTQMSFLPNETISFTPAL